MKSEDVNLDTVAQKLYGYPYESLSAWGKQNVNHVLSKINPPDNPYSVTLPVPATDLVSQRLANEKLAGENEQLRLENADLWQENEDLKEELAKLQSQWNRPSS